MQDLQDSLKSLGNELTRLAPKLAPSIVPHGFCCGPLLSELDSRRDRPADGADGDEGDESGDERDAGAGFAHAMRKRWTALARSTTCCAVCKTSGGCLDTSMDDVEAPDTPSGYFAAAGAGVLLPCLQWHVRFDAASLQLTQGKFLCALCALWNDLPCAMLALSGRAPDCSASSVEEFAGHVVLVNEITACLSADDALAYASQTAAVAHALATVACALPHIGLAAPDGRPLAAHAPAQLALAVLAGGAGEAARPPQAPASRSERPRERARARQ